MRTLYLCVHALLLQPYLWLWGFRPGGECVVPRLVLLPFASKTEGSHTLTCVLPPQAPQSLKGAWTVKPPSRLSTREGFTRGRLLRPQAPGPHPSLGAFKETAFEGNLVRGLLGAKSTGHGRTIRQGVCTSLGWFCLVLFGYLWVAVLQVISRKDAISA